MDLSFSGTAQSCGTTVPDLDLNSIGQVAVCGLRRPCATKVQIQVLEATFAKIARTFSSFGTQTGWNPGDTLTTAASLGLLGLAQSSTYTTDTTAWPDNTGCASSCACTGTGTGTNASYSGTCGVFQGSVVTDDDGDGMPGITANPKNDTGSNPTYTYPPTTTTVFSTPPLADQVYIVSRNEVQLTGMRMNDCTHGAGTAKITLFDNHVVGCHATATSTNGDDSYTGPPGLCDSTQVAFLDDIRPIYTASNGTAASPSNPIMGTVIVQELAANATCEDVLAF
jgi:hypothetical protein